jgi:DNA polymerase
MSSSIKNKAVKKRFAETKILIKDILNCQKCREIEDGQAKSIGTGNPLASIMFIKEATGAEEAKTQLAFANLSGEAVLKALLKLNINLLEAYGTNVIKCYTKPPYQLTTKFKNCLTWLRLEIDIILPKVIVAMGKTAWQALQILTESGYNPLDKKIGYIFNWRPDIKVILTHNPDNVLKNEALKKELWLHLKLIKNCL